MKLRRRLLREINEFNEDQLTSARILHLDRDLEQIRELKNEYQDGVEDFLEEYESIIEDLNVLARWRGEPSYVGGLV